MTSLGEFGLIARLIRGRIQPASTLLGPGDDAAVVAAPDSRVVVSTDMLVEGVHFRLDWSSPEQVGRKAAAVNIADVVAMGAMPTALLIGLGCPPDTSLATVEELTEGLWAEAGSVGAGVVGGDVVSAPQIVVSVTVLADLGGRAPVTRAGARPGDVLALAGRVGWAAAGLDLLAKGLGTPPEVVGAQQVPCPPYLAGPAAALVGATAMIDISDGLLADVGHLARSSGVAVDVRSAALVVPAPLREAAVALGLDPMRWLLTGGEDHALAATFPADTALLTGWTRIGVVREGTGVYLDGQVHDGAAGWDHFASA